MDNERLLADDFTGYSIGFERIPYYGLRRIGPWETRNIDYIWDLGPGGYDGNSQMWGITIADGRPALTQPGGNFASYICAGSDLWRDYTVEATWKYCGAKEILGSSFGCDHNHPHPFCGILARYQSQRRHYIWGIDPEGHPVLARREEEEIIVLYLGDEVIEPDTWHSWKLVVDGSILRGYLDGEPRAEAKDDKWSWGRVGFRADQPLFVSQIEVSASPAEVVRIAEEEVIVEHQLAAARTTFTAPVHWRVLERETPWHNVSVADIDGDGRAEIIHASMPVGEAGADWAAALYVMSLGGETLWRHGTWREPSPEEWKIQRPRTGGSTIYVTELGGDGKKQIVLTYKNCLRVLDGASGTVLMSRDFEPYIGVEGTQCEMSPDIVFDAHLLPGSRRQLVVMNGEQMVALSDDLSTLWTHIGSLGHGPTSGDVNGDGLDEVMCGYSLLDCRGNLLWSIPKLETRINSDMLDAHADWTEFGSFYPGDPIRVAVAASQKGLYLLDASGEIVKRGQVGHVQMVQPGRYCEDVEGTQLMTATLWESSGIYSIFDGRANLLRYWEMGVFAPVLPLRWQGSPVDLILLSDYDRCPAILDSEGRILWQEDPSAIESLWRAHKVGFNRFRTKGVAGDAFAAVYNNKLVLYAHP